ncbi:hypothetical protein DFJ58DRAFT_837127 [Suillus subalutaceus]|uniref:uncharacterized protein n=1 Tax=Suillus subalutaceus TaxID=48586 RepID=UPI001B87F4B8|nr:uncharacterized protein DFJ58DRAFT_837127 [Suillus subalutaceus]KAG1871813.1 hypothetical protein DFJ58DRAFT_837127 [Suillus subalutaceus]
MKPTAPPIKRGCGRPRGSNNQPGAGHVGRPRNDGQPPRKQHNGHNDAESTTPVPNTSHSAMQTPCNDKVQHCGKESTPTSCRALAIDVDLDSEVFENLDPPVRVHTIPPTLPIVPCSAACSEAMQGANLVLEAPTASTIVRTPHILPISTDAQEQQSEPAASISPQTLTHQPQDFSESGPATTIHEADPPAESSAMGLIDVPENPYSSDLEVPAPRDDTESDQDEEASLEDKFCPIPDDGGEDEDTEHGRGTSTSGAGIGPVPFMQVLQSFHYKNFDNLHLQYLELVHDQLQKLSKTVLGWAVLPYSLHFIHTVVNEYSEIWSMLFMMTKGHDQYMPNLHEISESLVKFGHPEVQAVFTDNVRTDKMNSSNSLPLLEFSHGSWTIVELSNTHQVNHRFDVIMNHRTMTNPNIMVAFDMEWLVNLETRIHGPVDLIQVAYQNTVYLIKTALFLENGVIKLTHSLLVFLYSSLFKKVGVSVRADFKRLQNDCGMYHGTASDEPFAGHVELGAMAKERGATVKRTVELAKLVRILLGRHLPKDPQVCVSPWCIYSLWEWTLLSLLWPPPLVGLQLHSWHLMDRRWLTGIVALKRPPALNGVDVSPKRVVMTVSKVLVPSFLLPAHLQKAKQAKSLASFSSTPFSIVADIQNLHICPSTHDEGSDGPSSGSCTETLGDHQDPESGVLDAGYIVSSSPLMSTLVLNEDECDW